MKNRKQSRGRDQSGYSMVGVMIFIFVIVISGMSFFAMSARESSSALYRQETTEAFYLADAAIERARARFLQDRAWRDGWTDVACGNGTYSLAVADTVYAGLNDCVQLVATGVVKRSVRQVEVIAEVPPSSLGLAVHINGDADVNGGLCVTGNVHVSGDGDFGPNDVMLACGESTEGFAIEPPPIFTDPAHFPGATYYYVIPTLISGIPIGRIFDAAGNDITLAKGDDLSAVVSYNNGQKAFTFDFNSDAVLNHYFDQAIGIFSRNPGDASVVVNFGQPPLMVPAVPGVVANVVLDGTTATVHSTIVNTRFTGVTVAQRQDPAFWFGGTTAVKQLTLEPYMGIALLTANFEKVGAANVFMGTDTYPAYVYITRDMAAANANMEIVGAVTCLGDWTNTGFIDIYFDIDFLGNVPAYLVDTYPSGVSGTMRVLTWKEM